MTDYQTWAGKLHFFDTSTSEFLTSAFLKHRILNSLLININDDGDNNEKTKN